MLSLDTALRSVRCSMATCTRLLPQKIPGRIGLGARVDHMLRSTGFTLWTESIRCPNGLRLLLDTNEEQQRQIFWGGAYEPHVVAALMSALPAGGVALDVGANIGSIALSMAQACRRAQRSVTIHAFEPLSRNYERLTSNVELNGLADSVRCHKLALGASSGALLLRYADQTVGVSAVAVVCDSADATPIAGSYTERVAVKTLDEWTQEVGISRLDAIKIDIEGAEPLFFRGGLQTIRRFRPVIFGEFNAWWAERHGLSIDQDCFEPLWTLGYQPYCWMPKMDRWELASGYRSAGPAMENTLWRPL
jgi:FkbM family methyltransferase